MEQTIVEFCRFARESGIAAGVKESLEAVRAANAVGIDRPGKFQIRAASGNLLDKSRLGHL